VFTWTAPLTGTPNGDAPSILNASYNFKAEVEVPQGGGDGMLITQGGRFGGYDFYVLKRANPYSPGIWQNFAQGRDCLNAVGRRRVSCLDGRYRRDGRNNFSGGGGRAASASERRRLEFLQGNFVAPIGIRFMFELQDLRRFLCSLLHVLIIGRFCETSMMAQTCRDQASFEAAQGSDSDPLLDPARRVLETAVVRGAGSIRRQSTRISGAVSFIP
jgi:hypothetical protein